MKKALDYAWSAFVLAMGLIGIAGLSWRTFGDDGWAERFLSAVWQAETRNPLLMTPVIIGAIVLVAVFLRGGFRPGTGGVSSHVVVWAVIACGAYFTFEWVRHW